MIVNMNNFDLIIKDSTEINENVFDPEVLNINKEYW